MKSNEEQIQAIAEYWNSHIHDLEIARHPAGTPGFFQDLDDYRFEKLSYLPKCVDFTGYAGKQILEIGCGAGIDLVRFCQGGARVTGIDLSETAVGLARSNVSQRGLEADLRVMNGEAMAFENESFDMVYAHGVLQYTADAEAMAKEAFRVLKPGGQFIAMVYNKRGWLNVMSRWLKVPLEHEDAPVLEKYTAGEFRKLLRPFDSVSLLPERFPVKSRLHRGLKGFLYNTFFVGAFNLLPQKWVRASGWHLMAFADKA